MIIQPDPFKTQRVSVAPSEREVAEHKLNMHRVKDEPRVIIAMAHTSDYLPLASLTVPTVQRYCQKWGYSMYYEPSWETVFPNDGDRLKIRIYEFLYEMKRWDVFVWVDSDAMITNSEISINQLLADLMVKESEHFVWSYDAGGPNTGVYIARFTWQAKRFLRTVIARQCEMGWGDNTAMIQVSLIPPHNEIIRCVPGLLMNAYPYDIYGWQEFKREGDWETARANGVDFILHLPGLETQPNEQFPERPNRIALVQKYLELCK